MIHQIGSHPTQKNCSPIYISAENPSPTRTVTQFSCYKNINNTQIDSPKNNIKNFHIDYSKKVGEGNYSKVYHAFDKVLPNSSRLVVKIIDLKYMRKQKLMNLVCNQIQIMQKIHHDNVIGCRDAIMEDNWGYIFMDYCEGGSLDQYIKTYNCSVPETYESIQYIREILQGMIYLQKKKILHRDIKATNILFKQNRPVIADFGFARFFNLQVIEDISLGSLPYMAPQILKKRLYTEKADVWSFGILIYEIFHGQSPFTKSHNIQQLIQKVQVPIHSQSSIFRHDLSIGIREMIAACLQINYKLRPSFSQLRQMNHLKHYFNPNRIAFITPPKIRKEPLYQQNTCISAKLQNPYQLNQAGSRKNMIPKQQSQKDINPKIVAQTILSSQRQNQINIQFNDQNTCKSFNRQSNSAQPHSKISFGKAIRIKYSQQFKQGYLTHQKSSSLNKHIILNEKESIQQEKTHTFKELLLQIQQSRDYYKLGINIKCPKTKRDQSKQSKVKDSKITKINRIKERMIMRAYWKIQDVEELVERNKVNYGISPPQNRKQKVLVVISDYKQEFEKQIKKRGLQDRVYKSQIISHTDCFGERQTASQENQLEQSFQNFDHRYQQLLESDLRTIERLEIGQNNGSLEKRGQKSSAYSNKIKGFIDDLNSLRKNHKHHRQI